MLRQAWDPLCYLPLVQKCKVLFCTSSFLLVARITVAFQMTCNHVLYIFDLLF